VLRANRVTPFFLAVLLVSFQFSLPASAQPQTLSKSPSQMLSLLEESPETASNSYNRSFFPHWIDSDRDGCDTRREVLRRQSLRRVSCSLAGGVWVSKYDKLRTTNASSFDVDHFIPLKEAWESGAYAWDTETRTRFANDLDYKFSLIAVSARSNRSKSDRDPNNWMPPNQSFKCKYVGRWIAVKYRWSLSVDLAEKQFLSSQVANCGNKARVAVPKKASISKSGAPTNTSAPSGNPGTDPRFSSCAEAARNGYKGPYFRGVDPEYEWYQDRDKDGVVCE